MLGDLARTVGIVLLEARLELVISNTNFLTSFAKSGSDEFPGLLAVELAAAVGVVLVPDVVHGRLDHLHDFAHFSFLLAFYLI